MDKLDLGQSYMDKVAQTKLHRQSCMNKVAWTKLHAQNFMVKVAGQICFCKVAQKKVY